MSFAKVFLGSGHMIDASDRKTARFPKEKAEMVRAAISGKLDEWEMSEDDLAICGGACGADTLFGEEGVQRGAHVRLCLAQEPDEFVRRSVQHAGSDWVRRFFMLCEKAEVRVLPDSVTPEEADLSIYARVNLWMIESARAEASEPSKLHALLVWDEKAAGDGPGGTSDFEARVRQLGSRVAVINPLTIR